MRSQLSNGWRHTANRRGAIAALVLPLVLCDCGGGSGGSAPVIKYTVGGTVAGLQAATSVVLRDNGGDATTISANGNFVFPTSLPSGSSYAVTIGTQPIAQTCSVSAGSGTIASANVSTVAIDCVLNTYAVGGTVSGLSPGEQIVLDDNGNDAVTVSANGAFQFPVSLTNASAYHVTVTTQPTGRSCLVSHGDGAISLAAVTSIRVLCPAESALASFPIITAGIYPVSGTGGGVIQASDGNFYGMTPDGGDFNLGTIYRVTPAGVLTTLWSFGARPGDGNEPLRGLIEARDGNFYGQTFAGGADGGSGAVIRMTPAGDESVLWSFGTAGDGSNPVGNLTQGTDGNFYGTTAGGGAYGHGTVFRVSPAGVEQVLWSFGGTATDGQLPWAGVTQGKDGAFYGTTSAGGTTGAGTVFKVTPAGVETVLWNFGQPLDGSHPYGGLLLASDGNFYGLTQMGGAFTNGAGYRVTPTGQEQVVWSFQSGGTAWPEGDLIQGTDGALYGVTSSSTGSVFRATLDGELLILWPGFAYGTFPQAGVIQGTDGALYGTTRGSIGVTPTPVGVLYRVTF